MVGACGGWIIPRTAGKQTSYCEDSLCGCGQNRLKAEKCHTVKNVGGGK